MWNPVNPNDFSRFTPSDMPNFLAWWENQMGDSVAFEIADAFIHGVTSSYLDLIRSGDPIPEWMQTLIRWRNAAIWTYQQGIPLSRRVAKGLFGLFSPEMAEQMAQQFQLTPQHIAEIPLEIRTAFEKGNNFSLQWIPRLSEDARRQTAELLSATVLFNRNPSNAVPVLERILARDQVAKLSKRDPGQVTPEEIQGFINQAQDKIILGIARRAEVIARTESTRMMALGTLSTLKNEGETLAYIMPHAGSCPECRRLLDGRVFPLSVLLSNSFANIGIPKKNWVASVPQHPNCRHSIHKPPVRFRRVLRKIRIPDNGSVLEWYGLPGGEAAMKSLQLPPLQDWIRP